MQLDGECSLETYLKKWNWIYTITLVVRSNAIFGLFMIKVDLTEDGLMHLDNVIEVIFSYIRVHLQTLKTNESIGRLYRDYVNLKSVPRFINEDTSDGAERLTKSLMNNTSKNVSKYDFDLQAIQEAIDLLNTGNFNVMILSREKYDESIEYTEESCPVKYFERKLPDKWVYLWNNPKMFPDLCLPAPNPYIANDFTIIYDGSQSVPEYPTKVYENDVSELWFRQDDKFLLPTACCYLHFKSPIASSSVEK